MARALHAAGFVPEPIGLMHGFLVEQWCEGAETLARNDKPLEQIAAYIGARARLFWARDDEGAGLKLLFEMCRRNLTLSLGEDAARAVEAWQPRLDLLSRRLVRVRTDNKLDRDEWLRLRSGRLLKTDALDHHCAHDLIGCQDVAWDVAGANVEFDLSAAESDQLIESTEQAAGRDVDCELLDFYKLAYCCFRLGQAELTADEANAARYVAAVRSLLHQHDRRETRQDSLVG
jgi:hypothetical protein